MFIGHWAPAMVAATRKDAPSLPVLFIAAQLVDWAFFLFVIFGIEAMRMTPGISAMNPLDLYHMPYTHSLLGSAAWAAGFGALVYVFTRNRTGATIAALVVLSHWLLDLLVHVPDLTIAGSPRQIGLWPVEPSGHRDAARTDPHFRCALDLRAEGQAQDCALADAWRNHVGASGI